MDETLIRATLSLKNQPDFDHIAYINKGKNAVQIFVKVRPYMKEVLRQLRGHFELILYTSGSRSYANAILKQVIESDDDFFDYVLTRENCLYDKENKVTVKDLAILQGERDLKDTIIVDNCY